VSGSDQYADATAAFLRSLEAGRLAHAYVVVGEPETAGMPFTETVLKHLYCTAESKPCDSCPGCRQVGQHSHADVAWVEPESKSRVITVDQVRALNRQIAQSSFAGGWKVAVLVHADRLNTESGNAFLKTLEEPAGQSLLLLLTGSPQALLPTILSRCQRILLEEERGEADTPWLEDVISILAEGTPGDALERMDLASRIEAILEGERERIESSLGERAEDETKEVRDARIEGRVRAVRTDMLRFMLQWQRDVLMAVVGVEEDLFVNRKHADTIRAQAGGTSYPVAMGRVKAVEEMVRRLDRNLPARAVLEQGL
jgi:DNA polymerase-3 subunit delta'